MTITKKISALILAVIMLFSSAAMAANALDNTARETVNAEIDELTAGKKADFSVTLDNDKYKPGVEEWYLMEVIYRYYEDAYELNLKSCRDYLDYRTREEKEFMVKNMIEDMSYDKKAVDKYYEREDERMNALSEMMINGVMWIEYDQALLDSMVVPDGANPEKYKYEYLMYMYSYKNVIEAGFDEMLEFVDKTLPDIETAGKLPFPRFLKSGDKIQKGKSYLCCLNAFKDQSEYINKIKPICENLEPYFDKLFALREKRKNASEAEIEKIDAEIENLTKSYENELNLHTQAYAEYKQNRDGARPVLTINGKEMAESHDADIWVSVHDFGEAKAPEGFDLIEALEDFFDSIVDFFRKLFSFDFESLNLNLDFLNIG